MMKVEANVTVPDVLDDEEAARSAIPNIGRFDNETHLRELGIDVQRDYPVLRRWSPLLAANAYLLYLNNLEGPTHTFLKSDDKFISFIRKTLTDHRKNGKCGSAESTIEIGNS